MKEIDRGREGGCYCFCDGNGDDYADNDMAMALAMLTMTATVTTMATIDYPSLLESNGMIVAII